MKLIKIWRQQHQFHILADTPDLHLRLRVSLGNAQAPVFPAWQSSFSAGRAALQSISATTPPTSVSSSYKRLSPVAGGTAMSFTKYVSVNTANWIVSWYKFQSHQSRALQMCKSSFTIHCSGFLGCAQHDLSEEQWWLMTAKASKCAGDLNWTTQTHHFEKWLLRVEKGFLEGVLLSEY